LRGHQLEPEPLREAKRLDGVGGGRGGEAREGPFEHLRLLRPACEGGQREDQESCDAHADSLVSARFLFPLRGGSTTGSVSVWNLAVNQPHHVYQTPDPLRWLSQWAVPTFLVLPQPLDFLVFVAMLTFNS